MYGQVLRQVRVLGQQLSSPQLEAGPQRDAGLCGVLLAHCTQRNHPSRQVYTFAWLRRCTAINKFSLHPPPPRCLSTKDQADLQRCCGSCEQRVQVVNSVINASIKEFQVGCWGQAAGDKQGRREALWSKWRGWGSANAPAAAMEKKMANEENKCHGFQRHP